MSEVTVRAVQPVLGLDDGAVVTIERTPRVAAAIEQGRLVVVAAPIPGVDADAHAAAVREELESVADAQAAEARAALGVPDRAGSRAAWAEFLDEHRIVYKDRTTRDGLIALWEAHDCDDHSAPDEVE